MATHVALLRGINLGGRNRVAMADLRALVSELGHRDVSTYIQSGNVLFTAAPDASPGPAGTTEIADAMTAAITAKLGVAAPAVVLTRDELADVVAANPFPDEQNHKCLHAVFRAAAADEALLERITKAESAVAAKGGRDSVRSIGRTLYLHTPDGYGRSDLAVALMRITGSPRGGPGGTARNWATTLKLLALCAG